MTDTISGKSSCLCGDVTISASKISRKFEVCHCSMCRKWGGSPALAVDCGNEVEIIGEQNIKVFQSSEWAERAFCLICGTHLFYRIKESGQYIIPVGFFSEIKDFEFEKQIFIDEKPAYYCFANNTQNMTGAEVFEQYAQDG